MTSVLGFQAQAPKADSNSWTDKKALEVDGTFISIYQ